MKLWLISQTVNTDYDTYDSAVVAAETEDAARVIRPGSYDSGSTWAPALAVKVKYIGDAIEGIDAGVVCASFNAG